MVNAGAIAMCTLIKGETYVQKFERLLALARAISGNPELCVDEQVYLSEKATGSKNRALAYMMKAYGMIHEDVEEILNCSAFPLQNRALCLKRDLRKTKDLGIFGSKISKIKRKFSYTIK